MGSMEFFLVTKPVGIILGVFLVSSFFMKNQPRIKKESGLFIKKRPKRKCLECHGFGIIRCDLCSGRGFVSYERKYQHFDPCPKCLQKRYDVCSFCGGNGQRVLYRNSGKNSFLKSKTRKFWFFG
mmetsp:Transcript_43757/g.87940  ORF Transcript_43757/g.87940 Transcript_43757/m.87940 type:complete len:125 (+) Transcript_43757:96-470(+)